MVNPRLPKKNAATTAIALVVWATCSQLIGGVTGALSLAGTFEGFGESAALWSFGGLFFLLGLAHTGIRVGRKTWIVDYASADNRARLVAVSNTLMGIVLLLGGAFGLLAEVIGEGPVILVFAILGLCGAALALTLPEA